MTTGEGNGDSDEEVTEFTPKTRLELVLEKHLAPEPEPQTEVEKMCARTLQIRETTEDIRGYLEQIVDQLRSEYPGEEELIERMLDGQRQRLATEREKQKRLDRASQVQVEPRAKLEAVPTPQEPDTNELQRPGPRGLRRGI